MASEGPEESFSWINVNGARLAYQEIGQGEPIVLVHANISDIRSWDLIKTRLAERFRVLLYSRRYHWLNESILKDASDP
jgi:pimeloyl-ACP methyl ester carboxylesterase